MASYDIRVVAEYNLSIEADDEAEAIELAERYVELGQEVPDEVSSEVTGSEEEDDEDEDDEDDD